MRKTSVQRGSGPAPVMGVIVAAALFGAVLAYLSERHHDHINSFPLAVKELSGRSFGHS